MNRTGFWNRWCDRSCMRPERRSDGEGWLQIRAFADFKECRESIGLCNPRTCENPGRIQVAGKIRTGVSLFQRSNRQSSFLCAGRMGLPYLRLQLWTAIARLFFNQAKAHFAQGNVDKAYECLRKACITLKTWVARFTPPPLPVRYTTAAMSPGYHRAGANWSQPWRSGSTPL